MTTTIVYEKWKRHAAARGWNLPVNDSFSQDSWVNYWIAMDEYERKVNAGNLDPGRPVAPHRSAANLGIVRPPPAVALTLNRDPVRAIEVSIAVLRDIVQRHPDVLHDFDCDSFIATELEPALQAMQSPAATSPIGDFADVVATYDDIVCRLDRPDPEADFVMRGSDWRTIRPAIIIPAEVVGATPRTDGRAFFAMTEGALPTGIATVPPGSGFDIVARDHPTLGPCVEWKVVTVQVARELERTCDAFMRIAHSHNREITRLRAKLALTAPAPDRDPIREGLSAFWLWVHAAYPGGSYLENVCCDLLEEMYGKDAVPLGAIRSDDGITDALRAHRLQIELDAARDTTQPMLVWLEQLYKACPHAEIIYNDDPDAAEPVGYTLRIESCSRMNVTAPTLTGAIALAMSTQPDEDSNVIAAASSPAEI